MCLEPNPIPTEEVCQNFNDLRNEIVLLNELKNACSSSVFELHSLRHEYEVLNRGCKVVCNSKMYS